MYHKPFEIRMSLPPQGEVNGSPSPPPSGFAKGFATGARGAAAHAAESDATEQSVPSESTIRRWIEELEEAIVVLDEGIIIETNRRAPSLFGRQVGAIRGCHIKELVTEESLIRLAHFLEFDAPEPAQVLGLRQDHRTFPLQLKAVASIIAEGRRLRVTALTRCGAIERLPGQQTLPPESD